MDATHRSRRFLLPLLLGAALLSGAAACGSDDAAEVSTSGPSTEPPPGSSAPVDPDEPVASPPGPGSVDPGAPFDLEPIDIADAEILVGRSLADAEAEAERRGWTVRVARLDGEDLMLTEDYSPTRVNVAVEADLVVEVVSIG